MKALKIDTDRKTKMIDLGQHIFATMLDELGGEPDTRPVMGTDYVAVISVGSKNNDSPTIPIPGYKSEFHLPVIFLRKRIMNTGLYGLRAEDADRIIEIISEEGTDYE